MWKTTIDYEFFGRWGTCYTKKRGKLRRLKAWMTYSRWWWYLTMTGDWTIWYHFFERDKCVTPEQFLR
jgi:hypothetical protein